MGIREVEIMISGTPHTVQVNDADKGAAHLAAGWAEKAAKPAANKQRTPSNKAAKPAANKQSEAPDGASDPGASEA